MELETPTAACPDPARAALIEPYCMGDLREEDQQLAEEHLLVCIACWQKAQRLQPHVDVLVSDRRLTETVATPEGLGVLGMSGALDRPLAGHLVSAMLASGLFALLFAVPVIVEIAYQFDRFGQRAIALAPVVFLWMFATSVLAFWIDVRSIRRGTGSFWRPLLVLVTGTTILCAVLLPLLPVEPTVAAHFQTYPTRLGYLKSVFYAWLVGPALVFWPVHFVVSMQKLVADRRHAFALRVLNRDKGTVAPRGLPLVPVWAFTCYAGVLLVFHIVGVSHLFDNLRPSPYLTLFMTLVLVRVATNSTLALAGVFWYWSNLTELKRECLAVARLSKTPGAQPL